MNTLFVCTGNVAPTRDIETLLRARRDELVAFEQDPEASFLALG